MLRSLSYGQIKYLLVKEGVASKFKSAAETCFKTYPSLQIFKINSWDEQVGQYFEKELILFG